MAMRSADRKPPFTWPPKPRAEPPKSPTPVAQTCRGVQSPPADQPTFWSCIEDTFLGVTARPLPVRAVEEGWSPDEPNDYCPRCGRTADRAPLEGCMNCRDLRLAWTRMVRLGAYTGPLRTWIHEVKYTRWRRLGHDLGLLLGERLLAEFVSSRMDKAAGRAVIVPVPDSALRRLCRGIDHAMVIARGVRAATGWPIVQPLRRRFGPAQTSIAPSARANNVAKSFGLRSVSGIDTPSGGLFVLVDDVCTTGATLRTCARLLVNACRKSGCVEVPEIWTAVLARAEVRTKA
ncbi:MAG: ComF family protein [Phycisphaerales bacterium]